MNRFTEYIWNRSTKKSLEVLDFEQDCEVIASHNDTSHQERVSYLEPPEMLEMNENVLVTPTISHTEYTQYKLQYMSTNESGCMNELSILFSNVQKKMNDIYYDIYYDVMI